MCDVTKRILIALLPLLVAGPLVLNAWGYTQARSTWERNRQARLALMTQNCAGEVDPPGCLHGAMGDWDDSFPKPGWLALR